MLMDILIIVKFGYLILFSNLKAIRQFGECVLHIKLFTLMIDLLI